MSADPSSSSSSSSSSRPPSPTSSLFFSRYRSLLLSLRTPNKTQIHSLTVLAQEHPNKAEAIVGMVGERFRQINSGDERLPLLYLLDSLLSHLSERLGLKQMQKALIPHVTPMIESTVKRASKTVQGSVYRMYTHWKLRNSFPVPILLGIEAVLKKYMSASEIEAALNRPSKADLPLGVTMGAGSAPSPPPPDAIMDDASKKRAASSSPFSSAAAGGGADVLPPPTKRAVINDPRRAAGSAFAAPNASAASLPPAPIVSATPSLGTTFFPPPPPAPAATAAPLASASAPSSAVNAEVQQLLTILSSPEITARLDLVPLVLDIKRELTNYSVASTSAEEVHNTVLKCAARLQEALLTPAAAAAPVPPPQPSGTTVVWPGAGAHTPASTIPYRPSVTAPRSASEAVAWANRVPSALTPSSSQDQLSLLGLGVANITFSDKDLKARHPAVIESLSAAALPFSCKQCGQRFSTSTALGHHLDWHYQMQQRAQLIEKKYGGEKNQQYYWEEWEWIQADDVVFGVTKKMPAMPSSSATSSSSTSATSAATGGASLSSVLNLPGMEYLSSSASSSSGVPSDDTQPRCPLCGDAFRSEWSDEEEGWMYRECLRVQEEWIRGTQQVIEQQKQEAATAAAAAATAANTAAATTSESDSSSGAAAALASKEADRQLYLYRAEKYLAHLQRYRGLIIHQTCHVTFITTNNKAKPTPPAKQPTTPHHSPLPLQHNPAAATTGSKIEPTMSTVKEAAEEEVEIAPDEMKNGDDIGAGAAGAAKIASQSMEEEEEEEEEEEDDGGVRIILNNDDALPPLER